MCRWQNKKRQRTQRYSELVIIIVSKSKSSFMIIILVLIRTRTHTLHRLLGLFREHSWKPQSQSSFSVLLYCSSTVIVRNSKLYICPLTCEGSDFNWHYNLHYCSILLNLCRHARKVTHCGLLGFNAKYKDIGQGKHSGTIVCLYLARCRINSQVWIIQNNNNLLTVEHC